MVWDSHRTLCSIRQRKGLTLRTDRAIEGIASKGQPSPRAWPRSACGPSLSLSWPHFCLDWHGWLWGPLRPGWCRKKGLPLFIRHVRMVSSAVTIARGYICTCFSGDSILDFLCEVRPLTLSLKSHEQSTQQPCSADLSSSAYIRK